MTGSARALGSTLVIAVGVVLIVAGLVTANGTIWPPIVTGAGMALIGRLAWVAVIRGDQRHAEAQRVAAAQYVADLYARHGGGQR